jgi:hypothetical protein
MPKVVFFWSILVLNLISQEGWMDMQILYVIVFTPNYVAVTWQWLKVHVDFNLFLMISECHYCEIWRVYVFVPCYNPVQ